MKKLFFFYFVKLLGDHLNSNIDNINKRFQYEKDNQKLNYKKKKLLADAVYEIPAGRENEFLEFILHDF